MRLFPTHSHCEPFSQSYYSSYGQINGEHYQQSFHPSITLFTSRISLTRTFDILCFMFMTRKSQSLSTGTPTILYLSYSLHTSASFPRRLVLIQRPFLFEEHPNSPVSRNIPLPFLLILLPQISHT